MTENNENKKWFFRHGYKCTGKVFNIKSDNADTSIQENCIRCGGAGRSDKWMHTGYVCFRCGGHGKEAVKTVKVYTEEKIKKLNTTLEKRRAKAEEKRAAELKAEAERRAAELETTQSKIKTAYPELVEIFKANEAAEWVNPFIHKMFIKFNDGFDFTEKQIEAIFKSHEKCVKRNNSDRFIKKFEAANGTVTEGRNTFIAALISIKEQVNTFGYNSRNVLKALFITMEGVKIYGTLPDISFNLTPEEEANGFDNDGFKIVFHNGEDYNFSYVKGRVYRFKGTLTLKEEKFGFYSRPSNLEELEADEMAEIEKM